MTRATLRPLARLTTLAAAALALACASRQAPPELTQAHATYDRLTASNADARIAGEMVRAREAIASADAAVARNQHRDYVSGMSRIALRAAQTAEAADQRIALQREADSLVQWRTQRMLSLSEEQRQRLAQQQQLSEQEIAALREQNAEQARQADSLRREAERANAALNQALTQLRSLVVEITNLRETSRGLVISLSDILFDLNKATLKPAAAQNLGRIAAILKQYPDKRISVEGHTDATGPDAYNQTLSEERAASVRTALVAGGVADTLIDARGFGETQPVASNDTPAGRQQNRRVEIVVLGAGTMADAARAAADSAAAAQSPPAPVTPPDSAGRDSVRTDSTRAP
jgi:outer membrane protein OmpA-like peptidoglycan-associated protein